MIKGVFFDLGGTLRICDPAPEHQAAARRRMAELAGEADPDALLERVNARYEGAYRAWALGENRESGDYELWAKWLLPELPEEKLQAICHEMTYQYRQVKGLRHVVEGGLEDAQRLQDTINEHLNSELIGGRDKISLSVGIAPYEEGIGAEEWIRRADKQLYAIKSRRNARA